MIDELVVQHPVKTPKNQFHTTHRAAFATGIAGVLVGAALRVANDIVGDGLLDARLVGYGAILGGALGLLFGPLVVTIVRKRKAFPLRTRVFYGARISAIIAGLGLALVVGVLINILWPSEMQVAAVKGIVNYVSVLCLNGTIFGIICGAVAVWWDAPSDEISSTTTSVPKRRGFLHYTCLAVGCLIGLFLVYTGYHALARHQILRLSLKYGKVAPLPRSAHDIEVSRKDAVNSLSLRASFSAPMADIDRWLGESPGTSEATPEKPTETSRRYLIWGPGGGAEHAAVDVDESSGKVNIYVSW